MADEIRSAISLTVTKGTLRVPTASRSYSITMAGEDYVDGTQLIGTAEEAITFGEITTPGECQIENLDATNFVSIRAATGVANCIKIKPGACAQFCFATSTPYAIADTAPVRIRKLIIEA